MLRSLKSQDLMIWLLYHLSIRNIMLLTLIYMLLMARGRITTARSPVWQLLAATVLFHLSITYSQHWSAVHCQTPEAFLSIHQWRADRREAIAILLSLSSHPTGLFLMPYSAGEVTKGLWNMLKRASTWTVYNITLQQLRRFCPA